MRLRLALPAACALLSLFAPVTFLRAQPIEALDDRVWTSVTGTKITARLAYIPDRKNPNAPLLLIPADAGRAPLSIPRSSLVQDDQRYLDYASHPSLSLMDSEDLRKNPLTYGDGEPVPGDYGYFYQRSALVSFYNKKKKQWFAVEFDSLSAESQERLRKGEKILRPLETPTSARVPRIPVSDSAFSLKNVPLITQAGSYCVPTSAAMIARYHGLRTTQKELAYLSSTASRRHKGTWSSDMVNAMESLGFLAETRVWNDFDTDTDFARFQREVLPFIRSSLKNDGPLYVSFKAGVYGSSGHGCVIVGYDDRGKGELRIHNPWGKREEYTYRDFSLKACEVVRFHMQGPATGDAAALEQRVIKAFHRAPVDLTDAMAMLKQAGVKSALRLHGRQDRRDDKFEMERWALARGFPVLESALEHHPVCLVPASRDDRIVGWYLFRLEAGNPAPLVRALARQGWSEPSRLPLASIFKTWSTPVNIPRDFAWDMPLIEIDE